MVLRESPTTQRSGFFLDFIETDAQKKRSFAINDGEAPFYKNNMASIYCHIKISQMSYKYY